MVIGVAVGRSARNYVVVLFADVEFAAHDRFNANLMRSIDKMHSAKNIAMVSHGHGGHAEFMDAVDKFLDVASAIEQRVIAV